MNKNIINRNIIKGLGSVVDIWGIRGSRDFKIKSSNKAIHTAWAKVGNTISRTFYSFSLPEPDKFTEWED